MFDEITYIFGVVDVTVVRPLTYTSTSIYAVQLVTAVTFTAVTSDRVDTRVCTAAIAGGALVDV